MGALLKYRGTQMFPYLKKQVFLCSKGDKTHLENYVPFAKQNTQHSNKANVAANIRNINRVYAQIR
jgi:hypothetical protein